MENKTHLIFLIITTLLTIVSANPVSSRHTDKLESQVPQNTTTQSAEEEHRVFISYRRSYSRHLAMLIKVLLAKENITAYLDVEDLEGGLWDEQLMTALNAAPNFVLLLSVGTLDRCIGDTNYTDFLHKEIREAVISPASPRIIPVFDHYDFPSESLFSPEIQTVLKHQGVTWEHALIDASIQKLIEYLKEEVQQSDTLNATSLDEEKTIFPESTGSLVSV